MIENTRDGLKTKGEAKIDLYPSIRVFAHQINHHLQHIQNQRVSSIFTPSLDPGEAKKNTKKTQKAVAVTCDF